MLAIIIYFYHGCSNLTNQIAQKEVDKSHVNPQVIYQPVNAARAYNVIKWAE